MFTDEPVFNITERFTGDRLITPCVQNVLQISTDVPWRSVLVSCLLRWCVAYCLIARRTRYMDLCLPIANTQRNTVTSGQQEIVCWRASNTSVDMLAIGDCRNAGIWERCRCVRLGSGRLCVAVIRLQQRELKASVKEKFPNKHVTKEYGGVQVQVLAFLSWAVDRSEWWVSPSRPFYPQVNQSLPFEYEIRWFPESVLTLCRRGKTLACVGNRTQTWWSSNPPWLSCN
jgi:hypothetical protein